MTESTEDLQDKVRQRFTNTANFPDSEDKFAVGPDSAKALGYDARQIDDLPASVTDAFCGVGNPRCTAGPATILPRAPKERW